MKNHPAGFCEVARFREIAWAPPRERSRNAHRKGGKRQRVDKDIRRVAGLSSGPRGKSDQAAPLVLAASCCGGGTLPCAICLAKISRINGSENKCA